MRAPDRDRVVRIGAATAFYNDSRIGIAQLLEKGGRLDYIVFDFLSESVMGGLGRGLSSGAGQGFAADFIDGYILPHLGELLERGIRVVANAGGLDPAACAQALRAKAAAAGHQPRVGFVAGDNLTARHGEIVTAEVRDMFDDAPLAPKLAAADAVHSLVAYTGAFPIAAALGAGADIVLAGRAVDSALVLGPLIHEFGWGPEDFDALAAGTLAGHLLECSAQVTGGTFTDWRDVPDWAGIGMPIGEHRADGSLVLTKPEGTGGLVSVGTVAEQLLYEVNDPQRYYVADVVADFSGVTIREIGPDRVALSGARGLGRTATYKASLTYDDGWRAQAAVPITGLEAAAKARRVGEELFRRSADLLRRAQLPPYDRVRCDVIGGEGEGPTVAIARMLADHPDRAGAEVFLREQSSAISHMSVGVSLPLGSGVRPLQHIAGFPLPKGAVSLSVEVDGRAIPFEAATDAVEIDASAPAVPAAAEDADPAQSVSLVRLAWARSGDKGDLFNVATIAREPRFLPYIAAALTAEAVGAHYARRLGAVRPFAVDRYAAPGFHALNFVVRGSMEGGVLASPTLDPVAKGMAQLLLDFPVPISPALKRELAP